MPTSELVISLDISETVKSAKAQHQILVSLR